MTPEQRELHACCMKRHLCTDEHYHERDVDRLMAQARSEAAAEIVAELVPIFLNLRGEVELASRAANAVLRAYIEDAK